MKARTTLASITTTLSKINIKIWERVDNIAHVINEGPTRKSPVINDQPTEAEIAAFWASWKDGKEARKAEMDAFLASLDSNNYQPTAQAPLPKPTTPKRRTPLAPKNAQPAYRDLGNIILLPSRQGLAPKNASYTARDGDDPSGDQWNAPIHYKPPTPARVSPWSLALDDDDLYYDDDDGDLYYGGGYSGSYGGGHDDIDRMMGDLSRDMTYGNWLSRQDGW